MDMFSNEAGKEEDDQYPWRGVFTDVVPAKPIQFTIPELELPRTLIAPNFEFLRNHDDDDERPWQGVFTDLPSANPTPILISPIDPPRLPATPNFEFLRNHNDDN